MKTRCLGYNSRKSPYVEIIFYTRGSAISVMLLHVKIAKSEKMPLANRRLM
jgi:hypothetical protein